MSWKIERSRYLITYIISIILLLIMNLSKQTILVVPVLIICGFINIISVYNAEKLLITPLSVFSLIWLILVSITSFKYPIMEEMTIFEWNNVLIFISMFSFGGIIANSIKVKKFKKRDRISKNVYCINYIFLIISIVALIKTILDYGRIPLFEFAENMNMEKDAFRNHLWSLFSYLGYGSIIFLAIDDINNFKSKKVFFTVLLFIILLILTGERFSPIVLIILCTITLCKRKTEKKMIKKIIVIGFVIIAIFFVVLQFRGNAAQKQMYFIDTGIYEGEASTLQNTEIIRYFGMSYRLITRTYEVVIPGETMGTLTFSPILKIFNIDPIPRKNIINMYGYNATSIITAIYSDFGYFWPIIVIILSYIINILYKKLTTDSSLISTYITLSWMLLLIFSFYSYFNYLIIYFLHIPVYLIFLEILNGVKE